MKTTVTKRASLRAPPWSAFVLHRYDWSETSVVLDLFTRESGRVAAVAKGAKRPTSQLRSILLPFQRVQVALSAGERDDPDAIRTLRQAEWEGRTAASTLLRREALFQGFYLNELVLKLLPRHDPHPRLFDAYAKTLTHLAQPVSGEHALRRPSFAKASVRAFELLLMRELGWLPDLAKVTATQRELVPTTRYILRSEHGLTEAPAATDAADAIEGSHWLRMQAALNDDAQDELQLTCEQAPAQALRSMLQHQLTWHLGTSRLRTRDVVGDLRRFENHAGTAARMTARVSHPTTLQSSATLQTP